MWLCWKAKVFVCVVLKSLGITVLLADGQCIYKQVTGVKEHQQVQLACQFHLKLSQMLQFSRVAREEENIIQT
jgi:hypothetical protein